MGFLDRLFSVGARPTRATPPAIPQHRPMPGPPSQRVRPPQVGPSQRTASPAPRSSAAKRSGGLFGYACSTGLHEAPGHYAVIDLETSGLSPQAGEIIEIAVQRIDASGKVLAEFETLIRPAASGVGRTDIHGISSRMVAKAPSFREVAPSLLEILQGAVVVAHNASFEERFLKAQLEACGTHPGLIPALDSLWLARRQLTLENYKLDTVIRHFGVRNGGAHTAMGDVRALAAVTPLLLSGTANLKYPVLPLRVSGKPTAFRATTR